ncbi:hypothetical protein niasHS_004786 [Heterodera schachtii]
MERILFHKFDQNPDLAERLISTGEKFLVEASHSDRFWGAGATIDDIRQWNFTGRNTMGQLLMELREKLRVCRNDNRNPGFQRRNAPDFFRQLLLKNRSKL